VDSRCFHTAIDDNDLEKVMTAASARGDSTDLGKTIAVVTVVEQEASSVEDTDGETSRSTSLR